MPGTQLNSEAADVDWSWYCLFESSLWSSGKESLHTNEVQDKNMLSITKRIDCLEQFQKHLPLPNPFPPNQDLDA